MVEPEFCGRPKRAKNRCVLAIFGLPPKVKMQNAVDIMDFW
jgi:hypothetical protein